jgi:DNA-binding response OmpR family regulator
VDVHIRWLRKKLEPRPDRPMIIRTIRRGGYLFEIPAEEPEIIVVDEGKTV